MRHIGIDFGKKRVGVATSDEEGKFAFAHSVLPNDDKLLGNLRKIIESENIEKIVLGESKNLDGKPNSLMQEIEIFKKQLEGSFDLPVIYEPEFWTSEQAKRVTGENQMHDASAAALILQSYLDRSN